MASSVLAFITAIKGEVSNAGNSKVDQQLRYALVHALSRVSGVRATWNEGSFTFTSVNGVGEYSSTTTGFPVDAAEFDLIEVQSGATNNIYYEVRPRSLLEIRESIRSSMGNGSPYPDIYCWYAQQLMFAPVFTAAVTVRGYYQRDARRDSSTGVLIDATTASDAYTNSWFLQGEDLLWAKTMEIYHARFAVDDQRLTYYARQYNLALDGIHKEWLQKAASGLSVEPYI